ncbi:MAG: PrgI family protein [bacterium]
MQFKVPQFLDIEDKMFGPFTFREFVYIAGGAGFCFIVYKLLGLAIGAIPILLIAGFAAALTFYRPNNKPFINMLEAGFRYFTQNKLYIWKRHTEKSRNDFKKQAILSDEEKIRVMSLNNVRLSGSKLRDLAWSLDVLDLKKEGK